MAKDGTRRGGARPGAGRKKKNGQSAQKPDEFLEKINVKPEEYEKFPKCSDLLKGLKAERVYYSIFKFANEHGAVDDLPKEIVELFAMSYGRWEEAEEKLSDEGLTSVRPSNGSPCKNPLVNISEIYSKQAQNYWYLIWGVLKDSVAPPDDNDPMEDLLD